MLTLGLGDLIQIWLIYVSTGLKPPTSDSKHGDIHICYLFILVHHPANWSNWSIVEHGVPSFRNVVSTGARHHGFLQRWVASIHIYKTAAEWQLYKLTNRKTVCTVTTFLINFPPTSCEDGVFFYVYSIFVRGCLSRILSMVWECSCSQLKPDSSGGSIDPLHCWLVLMFLFVFPKFGREKDVATRWGKTGKTRVFFLQELLVSWGFSIHSHGSWYRRTLQSAEVFQRLSRYRFLPSGKLT